MSTHWNTREEEYLIPGAEALMASTMALMTGHVQSCCPEHRTMMAAKIVANLTRLSADPLLSPGFQTLLWKLRERWSFQSAALSDGPRPVPDPGLWLASPEVLQ
jgi:hypothetical protein